MGTCIHLPAHNPMSALKRAVLGTQNFSVKALFPLPPSVALI